MCTISPKIVCISVVRMGDIQVGMLGMMLDLLCVLPLCRLSIAHDVCASSATCPQVCGEQILSEWRDDCASSATCPQVCGEQILSEWRDDCASSATCPQVCGEQILSEWRDDCASSAVYLMDCSQ